MLLFIARGTPVRSKVYVNRWEIGRKIRSAPARVDVQRALADRAEQPKLDAHRFRSAGDQRCALPEGLRPRHLLETGYQNENYKPGNGLPLRHQRADEIRPGCLAVQPIEPFLDIEILRDK